MTLLNAPLPPIVVTLQAIFDTIYGAIPVINIIIGIIATSIWLISFGRNHYNRRMLYLARAFVAASVTLLYVAIVISNAQASTEVGRWIRPVFSLVLGESLWGAVQSLFQGKSNYELRRMD